MLHGGDDDVAAIGSCDLLCTDPDLELNEMSFPITNALDPQNVANDLSINVSLCSRYTQIILSSNSLCVCCVAECTSISVSGRVKAIVKTE
jgi:hypothetical protein